MVLDHLVVWPDGPARYMSLPPWAMIRLKPLSGRTDPRRSRPCAWGKAAFDRGHPRRVGIGQWIVGIGYNAALSEHQYRQVGARFGETAAPW